MAEKGFGVKEINLIGASGTPTIESPNNLNLNAVNVAISTNVSIGGTLSVTGNVSVGGTLTYEDVTNIDSVGIVTAAKGVRVNADSAFSGGALATNYISVGASQDLKLYHNGVINYIVANDARLILRADDIMLQSDDTSGRAVYLDGGANRLELGYDGSAAAYITTSNVQFLKSITASADSTHDIGTNSVRFQNAYVDNYYGDGSNLTNLPAPDIQVSYTVTANGSSAYRFAGNGVVSTADNPDLYLIRGQKYRFINNSGGSHPFQIRVSDGGTAYSTGVTNNGAASGNIDFAPTFDSPAQLVYQCTSHGGMVGNIYLRDAAGNNTNVGVTTFTGTIQVHESSSGSIDAIKVTNSTTGSNLNDGLSIGLQSDEDVFIHNYENTSMLFGTNDTTRLIIDSNGDLGLGIAAVPQDSGARTLHIHDTDTGSGARAALRLTHGSTGSAASNGGFLGIDSNPDLYLYNMESGNLRFGTGASEKMRLDSNNRFYFMTTSQGPHGGKFNIDGTDENLNTLNVKGNSVNYVVISSSSRNGGHHIYFSNRQSGSDVNTGKITDNNSNVTYNTSSDYRIKENVVSISDGITRVKQLNPVRHTFKNNSAVGTVDGWIAHELDTVCPYAVDGEKDAVNEDGTDDLQSVDYGRITPLIVAALKEAITEIETLKTEVAALKAK